MKLSRTHILVLAGLILYLVLFCAVRLPSLEQVTGGEFRRVDYFWLLLLPEDLVGGWFGSPPEFSLVDRVPVLAVAGLIFGCAFSLGWLLLSALRVDHVLSRLEVFVFSAAAGLNLLSTYVLLVGLFGLLDEVFLLAVPGAAPFVAAAWLFMRRRTQPKLGEIQSTVHPKREAGQGPSDKLTRKPYGQHNWLRIWGEITSAYPSPPRGRGQGEGAENAGVIFPQILSTRWLWLAAPFVLIIFLGGMLPPIDFDVREYHLQAPKEFFLQGRVSFLPHNVYANMAMGTEMHSLLAMWITGNWWLGALAGKTVIAVFAPLTALALVSAGRRLASASAGIVAGLVYISVPWVVHVSTAGLVEGAAACYLFLALYALLLRNGQYDRPESTSATKGGSPKASQSSKTSASLLILSGYLAGSAVATKYPAVLFVLIPLVVWVLLRKDQGRKDRVPATGSASPRSHGPRLLTRVSHVGVFLLSAAVACGLWFGKNWALTGNPTYPLLYEVFDGETWTAEKDDKWNRAHRPHDFSPRTLVSDLARVAYRSEWLSPLVMPLAALAFVTWWKQRRKRGRAKGETEKTVSGQSTATVPIVGIALYFGFVIATWWLLTHRIDRFWIPALPLAALLAGLGASWSGDHLWRRAFAGLLIFGLFSNFLVASSSRPGVYNRYFASLERLRTHPERLDPWHRYFNMNIPDGCVLMVGVADVFDLEVPVVYNTVFDDCLFEQLVKDRNKEQIRQSFSEKGITHLFVHWGEIERYRSPGNYGFTDYVEPAVFHDLVADGILEPLPSLDDHPGRAYRVVPQKAQ
jgi:4-amino-4-deoxy-L-arabinose transferase-like glycosyltransferase